MSEEENINQIEPQTRNHWVFEMPGADAFLTKYISLPSVSNDRDEVVISVGYHNAIGFPINAKLVRMCRECEEFDCKLKYLDKVGTVVDRWEFRNARIVSVHWGGLDYGDSSPMETWVTITCKTNDFEIVEEG